MEEELTLDALQMALEQRKPGPGLVHHSDRGSQYARNDYTDLLKDRGIDISMSRKGNPWEKVGCESFKKKVEVRGVLRRENRDMAEAKLSIARFLEKVLIEKRLHSALGYRPPAEFERSLPKLNRPLLEKTRGPSECVVFKDDGIDRSMDRSKAWAGYRLPLVGPGPSCATRREASALTIVLDGLRPAIPCSGWSQPEPVAASPALSAYSAGPFQRQHLPLNVRL